MQSAKVQLIFSLLSGCAYFAVILNFILTNTERAGALLGLYVAPAVICGLALVFIKAIRNFFENEQYKGIFFIITVNSIVILSAVLITALNAIYGV